VDADLRIARITPEVDLGDAAMLPEGGPQLLEAAYLICLARKRGLQIELESGSPTLRRPVSRRTDPLGRVMVVMTMIMIMVAPRAMHMAVIMIMVMVIMAMVIMPMIVAVVMGMIVLAVGAVHVRLHKEPRARLLHRARGQPHQLPELLRLRHVAS
jgi:hypothetical protein